MTFFCECSWRGRSRPVSVCCASLLMAFVVTSAPQMMTLRRRHSTAWLIVAA